MADQENINIIKFMKWVNENKYGPEVHNHTVPALYKCWTYYDVLYKMIKHAP